MNRLQLAPPSSATSQRSVSPSLIGPYLTGIVQKLNQFTRAPEYIAYLAYILSHMTQEEDRIRTIAGYLLKNNARLILSAPAEVGEFVKEAVLSAFNDSSVMIRNAASQDIVAFLGVLEPRNWPECLQHLVLTLDSTDLDRQEVSVAFPMPIFSFSLSLGVFVTRIHGDQHSSHVVMNLIFGFVLVQFATPYRDFYSVVRIGILRSGKDLRTHLS